MTTITESRRKAGGGRRRNSSHTQLVRILPAALSLSLRHGCSTPQRHLGWGPPGSPVLQRAHSAFCI